MKTILSPGDLAFVWCYFSRSLPRELFEFSEKTINFLVNDAVKSQLISTPRPRLYSVWAAFIWQRASLLHLKLITSPFRLAVKSFLRSAGADWLMMQVFSIQKVQKALNEVINNSAWYDQDQHREKWNAFDSRVLFSQGWIDGKLERLDIKLTRWFLD